MSDTSIIIDLLHEQDAKREIQIKGIQKAMDAGFNTLASDMCEMKEQNKVRNSRIEKMEKDTVVARWFQRNPGKAAIIAIAFVLSVAVAFHVIDVENFLKTKGIELKE